MEDLQGKSFDDLSRRFGKMLRIPRRPHPDSYSTPEGLDVQEQRNFLEWRKSLATLAEVRRACKGFTVVGRWCGPDAVRKEFGALETTLARG